MKPLELALVPTPGAKPEFLASVIPLPKDAAQKAIIPKLWESITAPIQQHTPQSKPVVVLEGYTRDAWAADTATKWQALHVRSVDGKNKLPGFVKYLGERQKTAFGRFLGTMQGAATTFVWVVSPKQTSSTTLSCRVAPLSTIPNCPLKPKTGDQRLKQQQHKQKQQPLSSKKPAPKPAPSSSGAPKRKGFGLLGNLVGAQQRTNHHIVASAPKASAAKRPPATTTAGTNVAGGDNSNSTAAQMSHDAVAEQELKTSGQVLADFRNDMEQQMLDFDIAPDQTLTVPIKLIDFTKQVPEADQGKVTMEVLKYIVIEQAEEVNDEWIAHKEPSEFMDEATIVIYKDPDEAPPEVLEDLNRAELPEEMLAQQRKIAEQRRQQEAKALKDQEQLQREALKSVASGGDGEDDEADLAALNTQKRDRRTIEEIQRDNDAKRQKMD